MAVANSYFSNSYTFAVAGNSSAYSSVHSEITLNAVSVIEYLSNYISWKGTLDFVVNFDGPINYGPNDAFIYATGDGLLPSYGGITPSGMTNAQAEALTGIDVNGSDFDAGAYLLPNQDGTLTNRGMQLYFDTTPDPYEAPNIPAGTHDFYSIYMHEVLHSMGFWSQAQHEGFGPSSFDNLTTERNGQFFFEGANTTALLGTALPLSNTGSRDHYATDKTGGTSPVDRGAVFEFGNYEENRWQVGQLELAVLKDLGYTVANESTLPLVDPVDSAYMPVRIVPSGTAGSDNIIGTVSSDTFVATSGSDTINGAGGRDSITYSGARGDHSIDLKTDGTVTVQSGTDTDILINIEKIVFSDGALLSGYNQANGEAAYKLYGGAFDRTPDEAGLVFWTTDWLDAGRTLHDAAEYFISSPEFISKYGSNIADSIFVDQLYLNVLNREGEQTGTEFWNNFISTGTGDRANVLVNFTQLPEFTTNVAPNVDDGFWVV